MASSEPLPYQRLADIPPRALLPLAVPTMLATAVVIVFEDPTYRLPFALLLMTGFVRGAARSLGVHNAADGLMGRAFRALGFAGLVAGWLLVFAVLVFGALVGLFGLQGTAYTLELAIILASVAVVIAAWFLWPWYVGDVLANWPRQDVRIATASGNRWNKAFLVWRMQQLAASGAIRPRGFAGVAALVVAVMLLAALGASAGIVARLVEAVIVVLLPVLHLWIVREAYALCARWADEPHPSP